MMSGYKLILGFIAIIVIAFLWIVLNEIFVDTGDILNALTSDADTITRNDMAISIFYYSLFFMIIVIAIYLVKNALGENKNEQNL